MAVKTINITPHWPGLLKWFRQLYNDHYHHWPQWIGIDANSRVFAYSPGWGTHEWCNGQWMTYEGDPKILKETLYCHADTVPIQVHYFVAGEEVDINGNAVER